jgi:hypothetical protein
MLLIVAHRRDVGAEALVHRWSAHDAHLLSCEDLSTAGWCHSLDYPGISTAVVGGRVISVRKIAGVLTLLPWVMPDQLINTVPADRAYVAGEMTAFLVSWLSELTCPVLNRPTATCLMGLNWRPEQWVHAAARAGIPVRPVHRRVVLSADPALEFAEDAPTTVTVIGRCCLGEADRVLAMHARRLAAVAGVDMLAAQFDGSDSDARLLGVDLRPDISSPAIADAILEYFSRSCGC